MIRFETNQLRAKNATERVAAKRQARKTQAQGKPVELAARLQLNRDNIKQVEAKTPPPKETQQPVEITAKLCITPTADGRYNVKVAWTGNNGYEERLLSDIDPKYLAESVLPKKPNVANQLTSKDLDSRSRRSFWRMKDGKPEHSKF